MIGLNRVSTEPYKCDISLIPINEVMMYEKSLPKEFINERGNYVTEDFIEWCKPLIGGEIQEFADFNLGARKEKI